MRERGGRLSGTVSGLSLSLRVRIRDNVEVKLRSYDQAGRERIKEREEV
jgi:hypothetical protein